MHSQVAAPPESHFIVPLAQRRAEYESPDGFRVDAFLRDLLGEPRFVRWLVRWDLPMHQIRDDLTSRPPESFEAGVRRIFELYARRHSKDRYADKTPRYLAHLPLLAEVFAKGRFVHIIRDGRNVALSQLELETGPRPPNLVVAARRWSRVVTAARTAGASMPERYLEVRYEDLIEGPEGVLETICRFLSLTFEPEMTRFLEPGATPGNRARNSSRGAPSADEADSVPSIFRGPPHGLRDWRDQMGADDIAAFDAEAGELLEELGYGRGEGSTSISARATSPRDEPMTLPQASMSEEQHLLSAFVQQVERLQRRISALEEELARAARDSGSSRTELRPDDGAARHR